MKRVLAIATLTTLFLAGCGGDSLLNIPSLFSLNFTNDSSTNVDFYVFENTSGSAQSVNGRTPTASINANTADGTDIPFISGTYQITVTPAGNQSVQLSTKIQNLSSSNAGTVRYVDNPNSNIIIP